MGVAAKMMGQTPRLLPKDTAQLRAVAHASSDLCALRGELLVSWCPPHQLQLPVPQTTGSSP